MKMHKVRVSIVNATNNALAMAKYPVTANQRVLAPPPGFEPGTYGFL